jgi:hypothetical protein
VRLWRDSLRIRSQTGSDASLPLSRLPASQRVRVFLALPIVSIQRFPSGGVRRSCTPVNFFLKGKVHAPCAPVRTVTSQSAYQSQTNRLDREI